ncbi:MAG: hypothetical protein ACPGVP_13680 [Thiolinea sp.]
MQNSPYTNAFITVAEDSNADSGLVPKPRGKNETIAQIESKQCVRLGSSAVIQQYSTALFHHDLKADLLYFCRA